MTTKLYRIRNSTDCIAVCPRHTIERAQDLGVLVNAAHRGACDPCAHEVHAHLKDHERNLRP